MGMGRFKVECSMVFQIVLDKNKACKGARRNAEKPFWSWQLSDGTNQPETVQFDVFTGGENT